MIGAYGVIVENYCWRGNEGGKRNKERKDRKKGPRVRLSCNSGMFLPIYLHMRNCWNPMNSVAGTGFSNFGGVGCGTPCFYRSDGLQDLESIYRLHLFVFSTSGRTSAKLRESGNMD